MFCDTHVVESTSTTARLLAACSSPPNSRCSLAFVGFVPFSLFPPRVPTCCFPRIANNTGIVFDTSQHQVQASLHTNLGQGGLESFCGCNWMSLWVGWHRGLGLLMGWLQGKSADMAGHVGHLREDRG